MTHEALNIAAACRIEGPSPTRTLEFKTFTYPLVGALTTDLPAPPGAVRHDAGGHCAVLHIAPGRFLVPSPGAEIERHVAALAATGAGEVFDVEGKWCALAITGPGAARLLAATIDIEAVLAHRDCASVYLFDCPAVVARRADGFHVWVQASFADDLRASLDRANQPR